ncbi:MAG: hypothetical protein LC437_06790 [Thiohalomonas sp.]|nr:hypothetical protein [Thiohalomonas sp.]
MNTKEYGNIPCELFYYITFLARALPPRSIKTFIELLIGYKSVFKAIGRFFSGKKLNESEPFETLNEKTDMDESALKMDYKKKD